MDARSIVNRLNATFRQAIPEATVLRGHAAGDSGPRLAGRLQHSAAGSLGRVDRRTSTPNLQKFLAEARKRPELAGVNSPFSAAVPQMFVDVDHDKVLKEGVAADRRLPDAADVPRRRCT